jgi:hypothetical protein
MHKPAGYIPANDIRSTYYGHQMQEEKGIGMIIVFVCAMNNLELQMAIAGLEQKFLDTLDAYVMAIRTKEPAEVKEVIYYQLNKIKHELRELKHDKDSRFLK